VTRWVGLAATYDRICRYALADRAYGVGHQASVAKPWRSSNNQGFLHAPRKLSGSSQEVSSKGYAREPNHRRS